MNASRNASPPSLRIDAALRARLAQALEEDLGRGDVTSEATIPSGQQGEGRIFSRGEGVLCGVSVAREVARLCDAGLRFRALAEDGARLVPGMEVARLGGSLRSLLGCERLMLNFVQRLSGVATLTARFVDGLRERGSAMDVVDTRKTTPLWRDLEKHAVLCGGGVNHRFGLDDMYLIKNNHIDAAGGAGAALRAARRHRGRRRTTLAIEARNLAEVREILEVGADLILLDNMSRAQLRRALDLIGGRARTELTGGVGLRRIPGLAALEADRVSIGALTHSAPALDLALHIG